MVAGIIAEYNPFHNGHSYQLSRTRELFEGDIAVAMSGNFTQRGEVCVLDKYTRARHAILGGADIVLEIPLPFCTANAEQYAFGGVSVLSTLSGFSTLSFGCEAENISSLFDTLKLIEEEPPTVKEEIKGLLKEGKGFPEARATAFQKYAADNNLVLSDLTRPNTVLALEYLKALKHLDRAIATILIPRIGDFHDKSLDCQYPSATAIRLADTQDAMPFMPDFVYSDFLTRPKESSLKQLIMYRLATSSKSRLSQIYDMPKAFVARLHTSAGRYADYDSLFEATLSKNITRARLSRLLLYVLLDITEDFFASARQAIPINVLAIRSGKEYLLSQIDKSKGFATNSQAFYKLDNGISQLTKVADAVFEVAQGRKLKDDGMIVVK